MTTTSTTNRERPPGTARLTIDVPRGLHKRLRVHAAQTETTMTDIVVALLAAVLTDADAQRADRR